MPPDHHAKIAFHALATRYLLEEASAAEREQLVRMLYEPVWREMFDRMAEGWNASAANWLEGYDVEGEIEKVREVVARTETPSRPTAHETSSRGLPARRSYRRFLSRPRLVAATALSLAAVVALTVHGFAGWSRPSGGRVENRTWVRQVNEGGKHMEIDLGDGSKITLNEGSQLSYPSAFDARRRVVRLTGEAFFEVAKDAGRPFIVETGTLRITVLGTRFNVRAFADGTRAKVTLVSGKVQVTPLASGQDAEPEVVTLTPGMQYSLAAETGKGELHHVAAPAATSWMADRIVWDDEPFSDAMRELERRHGVAIELADPALARETVTARFQSETLPEVFGLLEDIGIEHRFEPSAEKIERVVLSFRPANSSAVPSMD